MEIANGFVCPTPEFQHFVHGITPAETVLIRKMHNQYSNGSPLKGLVIVGEAKEVDQYGKPLMFETRRKIKGNHTQVIGGKKVVIEGEEEVVEHTASDKPRTNAEELNRLRRKYTGNVSENGRTIPAFVAAFGEGAMIKLPDTFEEVRGIIGEVFTDGRPKAEEKAA